jgi:hypothetical protein
VENADSFQIDSLVRQFRTWKLPRIQAMLISVSVQKELYESRFVNHFKLGSRYLDFIAYCGFRNLELEL